MPEPDRPMRLPWPPILFLACLFGGLAAQVYLIGGLAPAEGLADRLAGGLIIAIGFALAIWAIAAMMRARTEIRPDRPATSLLESGPFRFSRNPIYEGEAIVLAGIAFLIRSPAMAIAALVFIIAVSRLVRLEENHLERQFGEAYRAYCERVPRFLLGGRAFSRR